MWCDLGNPPHVAHGNFAKINKIILKLWKIGNGRRKRKDLFFLSFLFQTTEICLFWVNQSGNFLRGKKHFMLGKKSGKMTLPPLKNIPLTPLPVISKTVGIGNFKGSFFKMTLQRNRLQSYTKMVTSQKVVGVWTWFWYQIKAESVFRTVIPKTYFIQNDTCSLCESASYTYMMRSVKTIGCRKMQNLVFGLILKLKVSSFQNCLNFVSMTFTSKVIIKWCWAVLYCYSLSQ